VSDGSYLCDVPGLWTRGEEKAKFGYDFWYQPHWDVMVSSEWGAPKSFKKGFTVSDTQDRGTYRLWISQNTQNLSATSRDIPRSAASVSVHVTDDLCRLETKFL
jgi:hypothetical protein